MAVGFHVHLGIALYGSILVLAIALLIYTLVNGYETVKSIPSVFLYSLSAYLVARIIHLAYNEIEVPTVGEYDVSFVISWLATCLFFTAFTVVLASWVQVLRQDFALSGNFTQTINFMFVGTNLVVYLFYLAMMIVFFATRPPNYMSRITPFGRILLLASSIIYFVFSSLFLIVGQRLYATVTSLGQSEHVRDMSKTTLKIVLLTVATVICFIIKFVVNAMRFAGDNRLETQSRALFFAVYFYIPDLFPISVQLGLQIARIRKRRAHQNSVYTAFDKSVGNARVVVVAEHATILGFGNSANGYDSLAHTDRDRDRESQRSPNPSSLSQYGRPKLKHTRSDVEFVDGRTSAMSGRSSINASASGSITPDSIHSLTIDGQTTPVLVAPAFSRPGSALVNAVSSR